MNGNFQYVFTVPKNIKNGENAAEKDIQERLNSVAFDSGRLERQRKKVAVKRPLE